MQPYFFPYIGYWKLMNQCDYFVIFDDVNYINKGFIDRNTIIADGKRRYIKLKITNRSQNALICNLNVHEKPLDVLNIIFEAYKKAPHFSACYSIIDDICNSDETSLTNFLAFSLRRIAEHIGIKCEFVLSSSIESNHRGRNKIIPIVKHLGGSTYINMEGGAELYNHQTFADAGLTLNFVTPDTQTLVSRRAATYGHLSIIDTLMHFEIGKVRTAIS